MKIYISIISLALLISLSYFFIKGKNKEYKKPHRLIFGLLLQVLVSEIIEEITSQLGYNNSLFYNLLFVYLETFMFLYFFYLISEKGQLKRQIVAILVVFLVFGILNSSFFQPLDTEFHNYSYAFGSLAIIGLAIKFFLDVFNLRRYENRNLLSIPYFWIVTVILFFYSATFFYFTPLRILYYFEISLIEPLSVIIQYLAGLMYFVLGMAFYAPFIFRLKY